MKQIDHLDTALCPTQVLDETLQFHAKTSLNIHPYLLSNIQFNQHTKETLSQLEFCETRFLPSKQSNLKLSTYKQDEKILRNRSAKLFDESKLISFSILERFLISSFATRSIMDPSRPFPSAGGLFPVEVIVCLFKNRIIDFCKQTSGVYHFLPISRELEPICNCNEIDILNNLSGLSHVKGKPNFAIAFIININRAILKYRFRGYRNAFLEVGCMSQQADLVGTSLGLANRIWSAFSDYQVTKFFNLNPKRYLTASIQWFGVEQDAI